MICARLRPPNEAAYLIDDEAFVMLALGHLNVRRSRNPAYRIQSVPLKAGSYSRRLGADKQNDYRDPERPSSNRFVVTNSPRDSNACFNWLIALSPVAELLALSMCFRSVFNAGSLSLMTHLRANTLASWRHVIRTVSAAPGKPASK